MGAKRVHGTTLGKHGDIKKRKRRQGDKQVHGISLRKHGNSKKRKRRRARKEERGKKVNPVTL